MGKLKTVITIVALLVISSPLTAEAAKEVGKMVGLRGTALIQREGAAQKAIIKSPIELNDVVETKKRSRAKLLFIDESMLTLGPSSKASIEKFIYSKEGGGASIFNLLDGAMRSVVGKNKFEVHTSTSVAAARGTIIEFLVGKTGGKPFTKITCLKGSVDIRSSDPNIRGAVLLGAGETVTVFKSAPVPKPQPAPIVTAPGKGTAQKKGAAKKEGGEGEGGAGDQGPMFGGPGTGATFDDLVGDIVVEDIGTEVTQPPIEQEPEVGTTPVTINVEFPQ
jgi:hypothetical protein